MPIGNESVFSVHPGNTELESITADVWNAGVVWAPINNLSVSVDFDNWKIDNEVATLSSDQLVRAEYSSRNGQANPASASCENVADWITRDAAGKIEQIFTPKPNVARQNPQALTASFRYVQDIGRFGSLQFASNYSNILVRCSRSAAMATGTCCATRMRCGRRLHQWPYRWFGRLGQGSQDHHATFNSVGRTRNYMSYLGTS